MQVADITFDNLQDEYGTIEKPSVEFFYKRLEEREKGVVFSKMTLLDTLGERPTAIMSMWTDRINKQVMAFVTEQKIYG